MSKLHAANPLYQWRTANGITRKQVAKAAGVTLWTVRNWELGRSGLRVSQLAQMVKLAPGLLEALGLK